MTYKTYITPPLANYKSQDWFMQQSANHLLAALKVVGATHLGEVEIAEEFTSVAYTVVKLADGSRLLFAENTDNTDSHSRREDVVRFYPAAQEAWKNEFGTDLPDLSAFDNHTPFFTTWLFEQRDKVS